MDVKKFNSIIDFAVERENEAVLFYQNLQKMVRFNGKIELLKNLENMEKGHIEILEQIRKSDFSNLEVPVVDSLKISDYLVPPQKEESELTYQDIIIIVMKREEASYKLYHTLSHNFSDANTAKLFEKLASEEAMHKLRFEEIYDQEILKDN